MNPITGDTLQRFSDHKAAVTDLYAVSSLFLCADTAGERNLPPYFPG